MHRRILALAVSVVLAACGGASDESTPADGSGQLVVERVDENGMTVVRNVSGSKWGGNAKLRIELEIGIDEGDERYMFGAPFPFWLTDDEIFVMESADGMVRVYGRDGQHRRDFGRLGEGPGEFGRGAQMTMTSDGTLAITTSLGNTVRTAFYTPAGEFLEEWRSPGAPGDRTFLIPFNVVPLSGSIMVGAMRMPAERTMNTGDREMGFARFNDEGFVGEPWFAPRPTEPPNTYSMTFSAAGREMTREMPVPWSPRLVTVATYDGSAIWSHGSSYRFQVEKADGTAFAVERVVEPVRIDPEEAEYGRRTIVAGRRRQSPDFNWNGAGMPDTKPWMTSFLADPDGRIWVAREGAGRRIEDCEENPLTLEPGEPYTRCWEAERLLEAFDRDGEYLGSLERPEGLLLVAPLIRGNHIVSSYEDELGVTKVRVYRLVLPGDDEST